MPLEGEGVEAAVAATRSSGCSSVSSSRKHVLSASQGEAGASDGACFYRYPIVQSCIVVLLRIACDTTRKNICFQVWLLDHTTKMGYSALSQNSASEGATSAAIDTLALLEADVTQGEMFAYTLCFSNCRL